MKILITGANGTIGSDLVDFFSKKNKVYALYRTPNFTTKNLKNKNIKWIKQDLAKKILIKIKPKIIIHCVVSHPYSKKNSYLDSLNSNIFALKNVINFANKNKVDKFFYLSSIKIYGEIYNKINTDSNIFVNPDILGASKILSEKILEIKKFNYLSIRLPGVFTYYTKDNRRPWLNSIINNLRRNKVLNIYNSKKNFNNIIDKIKIFKFIDFVMKRKKIKNGSFNFSARKPIVIKKMILDLKSKLSSSSKVFFKKKKTTNFIIESKRVYKDYKFKIASTSAVIDRYIDN